MKFNKHLQKSALMAAVILSLSACSSKPAIKEFPKSADAKAEVTNLHVALENSRRDNLDVLSPTSFTEAKHSLAEARKLEKNDASDKDVLKEVALGRAYLEKAEKNAKDSNGYVKEILVARDAAMDAKADKIVKAEFEELDSKLKSETTKFEEDEDSDIKGRRSGFIAGYRDLELKAIRETNLGTARRLIDKSISGGAKDLSPKSLADAEKKYNSANEFIIKNRDDKAEIETRSAAALEAAKNLDKTLSMSRNIRNESPEKAALRLQAEEANLKKTNAALSEEKQAAMALAATNSELASTNSELSSELSKEQELQKIYEKAQGMFTPDEAEVYKQGDNLVIRLRGLAFPKAESVIRGENFGLLKKVDDVIESFPKSAVVVEGHTDSTGGRELNQKLSDSRASAVRQYLEANTESGKAEFDSKGYGYEKPLASNKTAEGRAQNRRVDVIIDPQDI